MEKKQLTKKTWITSTLRRASYRWFARNEAKKLARVDRGLYKCAMCEGIFKDKDTVIDHIEPVVPFTGFPMHPITGEEDWTIFINRLFCDTDGFQILCDPCHDQKTAVEDSIRAQRTQDAKERERLEKKRLKLEKKLNKNK